MSRIGWLARRRLSKGGGKLQMSFYPKDVLAGVPDIYFAEQCLFLMKIGESYYDRLYTVCRDLLLQEGIQCRRADELRASLKSQSV